MAMERQFTVKDAHTRPITAIGYNPNRREMLIGCDDGVIKTFEFDTAKLSSTYHDHAGWVTSFLYWPKMKMVFSAANDSSIVIYGTTGNVIEQLYLPHSIYCMELNDRKNHLTIGSVDSIRVYLLDEFRKDGHYINTQCVHVAKEHTDLVKVIVVHEGRVYSGGYDQKVIFYDSSYSRTMEPLVVIENAHNAGVNAMVVSKSQENTWIATGSFDKSVKIWSPDGQVMFKFESFIATITAICVVPFNKTIWVAAGTNQAIMYDPKTGDNVSEFIGTFGQEDELYHVQLLKYCPEFSSVIGTSNRRHLFVWKYNSGSCVSSLKTKAAVECLCYTKKEPILMFSGDARGTLTKWERLQSNHFMYSQERFDIPEPKKNTFINLTDDDSMKERMKKAGERIRKRIKKDIKSHYAYSKPDNSPLLANDETHRKPVGMLKCIFIEELDYLIGACENSNIYVWGFDSEAVNALENMELPAEEKMIIHNYSVLLNPDSNLLHDYRIKNEDKSVTNRVAGFTCRHIFSEHRSYVSAICVVPPCNSHDRHYLLSGGWDSRVLLWDLRDGLFVTAFRYRILPDHVDHAEIACDGIITDIAYLPSKNEYAYSSTDSMIYIRHFSTIGKEMVLLNTLQGHTAEVMCLVYNPVFNVWVSAGDAGMIRVWETGGMNECRHVFHGSAMVQCLCVDTVNGAIIAGAQDVIKIFDLNTMTLVHTYVGHTDLIKSIIHVVERGQYVSAGTDKSIRIWHSWKPSKALLKSIKEKEEEMLKIKMEEEEQKAAATAGGKKSSRAMNQEGKLLGVGGASKKASRTSTSMALSENMNKITEESEQ